MKHVLIHHFYSVQGYTSRTIHNQLLGVLLHLHLWGLVDLFSAADGLRSIWLPSSEVTVVP